MNLDRLSPAPWTVEDLGKRLEICHQHEDEQGFIASIPISQEDDAEFIALARNAFEVMQRRGWYAAMGAPWGEHPNEWHARYRNGDTVWHGNSIVWHPDPFTAMVEADRWYENVKESRNG